MKYLDILGAKSAYAEGKNVTEYLRAQQNVAYNTSEIIEAAYDLQAGTYIEHVRCNPSQASSYAAELAAILDAHLAGRGSLLDIGTGELTTLGALIPRLANKPGAILAFDISWSRIYKGVAYLEATIGADAKRVTPFVANMREIPLPDKSIDVTTSSHALEPNGAELTELMAELFRVTAEKLVLFEPCYEINSDEGKRRMERLGYIRDIDGVVRKLGGVIVDKVSIRNVSNPLNPTVCFVIEPPASAGAGAARRAGGIPMFSVPGTDFSLENIDGFHFSKETGLCFPTLKSIPILRSEAAILASALLD